MADLTPARAMRQAKLIADVYAEATTELIRVVARQVARGMTPPGSTAAAQLSELVQLRDAAQRVVERAQAQGGAKAVRLIEEAYRGGLRASPAGLVAVNQGSVRAIAQAILGDLDRAGPQMLRWADDVYRQVTAATLPLGVTGAVNRRTVTARMLDRYAAMGVTGFVDSSGARWRIEAYAEMAARTGLQRAHLAGTVDRITGQGADLVIVTTSPSGCPLCRPFEAKVFSLSGTDPDHPPLSQAEAGGLFHPNCTHTVNRYVPGLTRDVPAEELRVPDAAAEYRRRQRERVLARRVQESRRRVAAAKEVGDPATLAQQRALLHARLEALRAHRVGGTSSAAALTGDAAYGAVRGIEGLAAKARDAVAVYQGSSYRRINRALRGQGALDAADQATVRLIDGVFHPVERTVVVERGIRHGGAKFADVKPGAVISDRAFTSTSTNPEVARWFIQHQNEPAALVRITVPKGARAARLPQQQNESEVLLPRGTRMRVTKVEDVEEVIDQELYDMTVERGASRGWTADETKQRAMERGALLRYRRIDAEVVP